MVVHYVARPADDACNATCGKQHHQILADGENGTRLPENVTCQKCMLTSRVVRSRN